MELIERLLGLCALSGFITLLSKSTWRDITNSFQRSVLLISFIALLAVVLLAVFMLLLAMRDHVDTPSTPDIIKLRQEQFMDEELANLIQEWKFKIGELETDIKQLKRHLFACIFFMQSALRGSFSVLSPLIEGIAPNQGRRPRTGDFDRRPYDFHMDDKTQHKIDSAIDAFAKNGNPLFGHVWR